MRSTPKKPLVYSTKPLPRQQTLEVSLSRGPASELPKLRSNTVQMDKAVSQKKKKSLFFNITETKYTGHIAKSSESAAKQHSR